MPKDLYSRRIQSSILFKNRILMKEILGWEPSLLGTLQRRTGLTWQRNGSSIQATNGDWIFSTTSGKLEIKNTVTGVAHTSNCSDADIASRLIAFMRDPTPRFKRLLREKTIELVQDDPTDISSIGAISFVEAFGNITPFNNNTDVSNVSANVGDVLILGVCGRRNSAMFSYDAPTWNGQQFQLVASTTNEPSSIFVYRLVCSTSGTFTIALPSIQPEGNYGSQAAIVLKFNGFSGNAITSDVQVDVYENGVYHTPQCVVPNVTSGDFVVTFMNALLRDSGFNNQPTADHTHNGSERMLQRDMDGLIGSLFACTNVGSGNVTSTFTTDGPEVQFKMISFRLSNG